MGERAYAIARHWAKNHFSRVVSEGPLDWCLDSLSLSPSRSSTSTIETTHLLFVDSVLAVPVVYEAHTAATARQLAIAIRVARFCEKVSAFTMSVHR